MLAEVDHVVGYGPYLDRVPPRAGLHRHASGNTVELDRARTPSTWPWPASGWRWSPAATRACSGWPRRSSRRPAVTPVRGGADHGAARGDRRPGRGGPGGGAAGRRLRRDVPVGPAEALGADRAPAARGRGGRPGAGHLQPGLPDPAAPGERGEGDAARVRAGGHPVVIGRNVGRPEESAHRHHAGRPRPGPGGHELPADHRLQPDVATSGVGPAGVWRADARVSRPAPRIQVWTTWFDAPN